MVGRKGIYRNGKIELVETPKEIINETRVIVTFLKPEHIALHERGIDEEQVANPHGRLSTFAEDWDSPEMNIYDNYDASKSHI